MHERLAQQIAFLVEADKLKSVIRRTPLVDVSRLENSAEHSWHLVLVIMVLREYGPSGRRLDARDGNGRRPRSRGDRRRRRVSVRRRCVGREAVREQAAADRIFGLLPADQQEHFRQLWDEFEAQATPEARFANAVDRLQPLIQNAHSGGGSWCGQTLVRAQILRRMAPIETSLPDVWPHVLDVVEAFCAAGVLKRD